MTRYEPATISPHWSQLGVWEIIPRGALNESGQESPVAYDRTIRVGFASVDVCSSVFNRVIQ